MKLVSVRDILRFYLPLVLNSQMMTLSGPIINMAVGRAGDEKVQFAAFWIGFTILLFLESPCLVVQQMTAALVREPGSLRRLLATALAFAGLATASSLIIALTPLGDLVFDHLVKTTPRTAELARQVLAWLSPLPFFVALRGVGNGLAIREKKTPLVARATLFRLLALSTVVGLSVALHTGSGAMAGVAAILTGIALETLVIWIGVRQVLGRRIAESTQGVPLPFATIFRVVMPLAVSSIAWTSFRPLVNGILGRLADPELAQAGFGIIMPLVLLTSSPLWTIQNVSLVLPESRRDVRRVIRFAMVTAGVFAILILLVTATPVRDVLLRRAFSLTPELEAAVAPAMVLLAIEPFFLAARSVSQGLLMRAKRTEAFLVYSPIKIALVTVAGLLVTHRNPEVNGALLGTVLFLGGDLFDAIVYSLAARRVVVRDAFFDERVTGRRPAMVTPSSS
jgi:hypothetical protein